MRLVKKDEVTIEQKTKKQEKKNNTDKLKERKEDVEFERNT